MIDSIAQNSIAQNLRCPLKLIRVLCELMARKDRQGDFRLKKRLHRHAPEQIVENLHGTGLMFTNGNRRVAVLQTMAIGEATCHRWRNQQGGMKSDEAERLNELENENSCLNRLLAGAELDKAMPGEVHSGNG